MNRTGTLSASSDGAAFAWVMPLPEATLKESLLWASAGTGELPPLASYRRVYCMGPTVKWAGLVPE